MKLLNGSRSLRTMQKRTRLILLFLQIGTLNPNLWSCLAKYVFAILLVIPFTTIPLLLTSQRVHQKYLHFMTIVLQRRYSTCFLILGLTKLNFKFEVLISILFTLFGINSQYTEMYYAANRRKFFETFADRNGFDPLNPDNWYQQTRKKILSSPVHPFPSHIFIFSSIYTICTGLRNSGFLPQE